MISALVLNYTTQTKIMMPGHRYANLSIRHTDLIVPAKSEYIRSPYLTILEGIKLHYGTCIDYDFDFWLDDNRISEKEYGT